MNNTVVYVDIVFLGNMTVSYLILLTAGKLGRVKRPLWRLGVGAGLGGLYAVASLFSVLPEFFSLPGKIIFSLVMVLVSFFPAPPRRILACLGFFYVGTFLLGGMVIALPYLLARNEALYKGYSGLTVGPGHKYIWPLVIFTGLLVWAASRALPGYYKAKSAREQLRYPLVISFLGKMVTLQALMDTGNNLTEPLSGAPVIIVEYSAVRSILPPALQQSLEGCETPMEMMTVLSDDTLMPRLILIPFHSLGNDRGFLLGIRADSLAVVLDQNALEINGAVLGIYKKCLDPGREYTALLNPDILRKRTA